MRNEEAKDGTLGLTPGVDFGAKPEGLEMQEEVLFEEIPCVVPNKPGFEKGQTLYGTYLRTKRVISDKFQNESGERLQHVFESLVPGKDGKKAKFGIWGVGNLDWALPRVARGTVMGVRYEGQVGEPLKKGQDIPHSFTYLTAKGQNLNIDPYAEALIDEPRSRQSLN